MPAVSEKQRRFMQAVANNPKFAKKVDVPQSVGKEFTMKKMQSGGMAASKMGAVKTAAPSRDGVAMKGKTKGKMVVMAGNKMAHGGKVKKMAGGGLAAGHKSADGVAVKGKTRGTEVKMARGGKAKRYC